MIYPEKEIERLTEALRCDFDGEKTTQFARDLSAIIEYAKQFQWRPIEEAPKDGTPILVIANRFGWEGAGYAVVCVCFYADRWRIYGCAGGNPSLRSKNTIQWLDEVNPTHFMPTPSPPEKGGE